MKQHLNKYVILFMLVLLALGAQTVTGRSFVYPSEESVNLCIFLDINFSMLFTAYNNTISVASQTITQDDVFSVSGNCTPDAITLSFTNRTSWSFQFHQDSNGDVHLERTVQFIPSDVFRSRVNDTGVVTVKEEPTTDLFKPPFSYQCDKPEVRQYINKSISHKALRYSIHISVFKIHIQQFNINSKDASTPIMCVSGNNTAVKPISLKILNMLMAENATTAGEETPFTTESWNNTSAASPTTSTQTTNTPQPAASVNNYIVSGNNMHCILLQGAFTISIDYLHNTTSSEKTETASVDIPANATGTGNCNQTATSQNLVISFFDDWSLEIVFTLKDGKTSDDLASSDRSYGISNLTLIYVTNATIFPGSEIPPVPKIAFPSSSKDTDYPKKSSSYEYYKCNNNIKMRLENGIHVQARELLFKAFNTNNDTTFSGPADECAADEETSQTVPIAVACTLGGLSLVVAVVYAIGKWRKGG